MIVTGRATVLNRGTNCRIVVNGRVFRASETAPVTITMDYGLCGFRGSRMKAMERERPNVELQVGGSTYLIRDCIITQTIRRAEAGKPLVCRVSYVDGAEHA